MGSIYSFYFSYGFMYVMGNYKKEDLGAAATAALSDTKLGFTAASKESAIIGFTAASKEGSKEANSMAEPYGLFGNFGYVSPPSLTNNNSKSKSESEEAMKSRPKSPMSPLIMLDSSSSSSNSTPSDEERGLTKKNVGEEEPIEQVLKITPSVNRLCEEGMLIDQLMKEAIRRLNEFLTIRATPIPDSTILKYWSSEDEDMDPSKYFEKRMITLDADHKAAAGAGKKLYPSGFPVSMTIPEFLDKYGSLKAGQHMEWVTEYLAGKVMNKLPSSNLITYDLVGFGGQIQVMAFPKLSCMDEATFFQSHSDLKNGDYIGVIGFPGKSSMGELSVIPKIIVNLSYCLHKMPPVHYKKTGAWTPGSGRNPDAYILNDQETRYHRRFLDLTINPEVKDICKTRTKVVSYIRHFLENLGFLEVETPTLTVFPRGGGAKRGAFVTHHDDDLKMKMVMRNGDENVYLKQLVVGGIERVFEIGKQFRNNEGGVINDMMHNPEITTCEFYMALKTYKDLMELTEQILSGMVKEVTGGYKVMYHANGYHNPPIEIDFTPPFRRICMIEELEKMANLSIPKDLGSEEARQYLADACTKFGITCSSPQTTPRLLHKLVGHFLEVTRVVNPTFIIDPPEITSPLAKAHEDKQGLTERFILFVNKLEVANGYTVENDLVVQHQRFSDQLKSGNEEAMAALDDETFWMALEYGFPPTAAWVLDIDRLTMFLTDSLNIKEVVLFPAMKPQPHYKSPTIKGGKMVPTGGLNNDDFVEENDTSTVAVTIQEALTASKTLQRFLLQSQNTTPDDEYHLNAKLRDELELNLSKLFKK